MILLLVIYIKPVRLTSIVDTLDFIYLNDESQFTNWSTYHSHAVALSGWSSRLSSVTWLLPLLPQSIPPLLSLLNTQSNDSTQYNNLTREWWQALWAILVLGEIPDKRLETLLLICVSNYRWLIRRKSICRRRLRKRLRKLERMLFQTRQVQLFSCDLDNLEC